MRPILIVKVGSAAPVIGADKPDIDRWIADGLDVGDDLIRVCIPNNGEPLPNPLDVSGVVVTGSAAMVTDKEEWSERTALWLRDVVAAEVPILGICYGHQLLAYALGGVVDNNPNGIEMGTVDIHLTDAGKVDDLFRGLPTQFLAQASHTQSVLALPEGAYVLASNGVDLHHAFKYGTSTWGVQFHPEFDVPYMRALIEHRRAHLLAKGLPVDQMLAQVRDTPLAYDLLARFAQWVKKHTPVQKT